MSDEGWKVAVTNHYPVHNHPIGRDRYRLYAGVRSVIPPNVASTVRQMRRRNADRRTIWNYIRDNGAEAFQMKDLHNL